MAEETVPPTPSKSSLYVAMIALATLAWLAHFFLLVSVARELGCRWTFTECREPLVLAMPDTQTYEDVADEILAYGPWKASYLRRSPGYPLLLAAAKAVSGTIEPVLWCVPLAAAFAAAALVWMGVRLAGNVWAGVTAGFLFCAWPAVYQFEPLILTDALHGMLFPVALALTLAWTWRERPAVGGLAVFVWCLMQLIRPTFALIVLVWPMVLLKAGVGSRYRRLSLAACGCLVVVPGLIVTSNFSKSGVATLSEVGPKTMAAYAIPRLQEDLGLGDFRTLRQQAFERYEGLELGERIMQQKADARRWITSHPLVAVRSFARGVAGQMLWPPRPWFADRLAHLFPRWTSLPRAAMPVFWSLAGIGLVCVARRRPRTALMLALMFPLVMLPASVSHFVEGRLRFPLDLLAMPLIAVALFAGIEVVCSKSRS